MDEQEVREQISRLQIEIESLKTSVEIWQNTVSKIQYSIGSVFITNADKEDLFFAQRRLFEHENKLIHVETQLYNLQSIFK